MKKLLLALVLILLLGSPTLFAQQADPFINIVFQPATIQVGTSGKIWILLGNDGATAINSGCLSISITVPSFGKITELIPTPGFSATIANGGGSILISNSGTSLSPITEPISVFSFSVVVQGIATGNTGLIVGNVGYDPNQGAVCAQAGDLTTTNNRSTTSMTVEANPLPVSLVSFTAKAQPNHRVELAWTTSQETNNQGFLLERSTDLQRFEEVGEVPTERSGSSALTHYFLLDSLPYSGTSYYRLTQLDLSGKRTVYPAISVVLRDDGYGIAPNPVVGNGQFVLRLDEPERAIVSLYSLTGHLLPLQKMRAEPGQLVLKPSGKLSTGVYLLIVTERGQIRRHRLVIE